MANEFKSGFVTFIGRPNVGKSTLMNRLIGQKIAITSSKPQTTRNRIQTVYTDERGQIIFLDTPGINKAKNKLGNYMLQVAERTLNEVDVVLWLVEQVRSSVVVKNISLNSYLRSKHRSFQSSTRLIQQKKKTSQKRLIHTKMYVNLQRSSRYLH